MSARRLVAQEIYNAIIVDLLDRQGIGNIIDQMDAEDKQEMKEEITNTIEFILEREDA